MMIDAAKKASISAVCVSVIKDFRDQCVNATKGILPILIVKAANQPIVRPTSPIAAVVAPADAVSSAFAIQSQVTIMIIDLCNKI